MSVTNFIPELWSQRMLEPLNKSLVFADVANRNYEGEIQNDGDLVRITGIGPITVSAYAGTVTYTDLNDQQATLAIDRKRYWAFPVEDVDKVQANVNFMDQAMRQAAYSLKDDVDAYIAGLYGQAGTAITTAAINSVNAIAALQTMSQYLDEANVPSEGRWVVIPPWVKTKLVLAKAFLENTTNDALDNGRISRCCGFDVRISNNVYNDATTWQVLAGTNQAISFAQQLLKTEALRADAAFADHVRGLLVYGAKVVIADALVCFPMTVAAEP